MNRLEFRKRILAENDAAAAKLRARFAKSGTLVVDVVSSPGSGKTSLLEATARSLAGEHRLSAIVGDPTSAAKGGNPTIAMPKTPAGGLPPVGTP